MYIKYNIVDFLPQNVPLSVSLPWICIPHMIRCKSIEALHNWSVLEGVSVLEMMFQEGMSVPRGRLGHRLKRLLGTSVLVLSLHTALQYGVLQCYYTGVVRRNDTRGWVQSPVISIQLSRSVGQVGIAGLLSHPGWVEITSLGRSSSWPIT